MDKNGSHCCSFPEAQRRILKRVKTLPGEIVRLKEAQHRIVFSDVLAVAPQPSFDESTRDGYVIGLHLGPAEKINRFEIVDEIPAGKPYLNTLATGTACKIMTGGCVPKGGVRVVPYEDCAEQNGDVIVPGHLLQSTQTFIRKAGSEIVQGEQLMPAGDLIQAGHLALLSSCGMHSVAVTTRPLAGYVCTGSELTTESEGLEIGQKYSSNSFLIGGLLASVGASSLNLGIIEDHHQNLLDLFAKVKTDELDVMITTGGMGPGKYDLVERSFVEAGGKVVFNAISMRPGKAILFGFLGRTLFFGLPGPPHAVRTLLNVLVGPALLAIQGIKGSWPKKVLAHLQHQIKIKRNDVLRLKDGVLTMEEGRCSVRFAGGLEVGNCFILLPPGQAYYGESALVEVYLALDLRGGLLEY